jgi:hypothetical protein
MKERVDRISALPSKRVYFSIIVEYTLEKAICELIDNVVDAWSAAGRKKPVTITLDLDSERQTIRVADDAGGVREEDLSVVVAPGATLNAVEAPTIGIFGVGSKRAVIALAEDVAIRTHRTGARDTFQVEFDKTWIDDTSDWDLDYFRVNPIPEGTTEIDLSRLRITLTKDSIGALGRHLSEVYAVFLKRPDFKIRLGLDELKPTVFADWAFPPDYPPREYVGEIETGEGDKVRVRLRAGLMRHSSQVGEYGVYLYCNDRFIVGALKDPSVGFTSGLLGQMHPSLSLLRAELWLKGPARAMPWNSTKSGLYQDHRVFVALRDWLVHTLKDWASLSRRLAGEWQEKVTPFEKGKLVRYNVGALPAAGKSYLPALPPSKPRIGERLREANREVAEEKPWVTGLFEQVAAADIILRQHFEEKNRIALIVLDSVLEIGLKEYLVHGAEGDRYGDDRLRRLFNDRQSVHREVQKYVEFPKEVWRRIDFFYDLRSKMIHERATVAVSDGQIRNFRTTVQTVLNRLFDLQFED